MTRNWKPRRIPLADDELRLLSLFLDAVGREHGGDELLETEQNRLEAREAGRLGPTARLAPEAPVEILALFRNGGLQRALDMAGCTKREGDAMTMAARQGMTMRELQFYLGGSRKGFPTVALSTVENTLYSARVKLRRLLCEEDDAVS